MSCDGGCGGGEGCLERTLFIIPTSLSNSAENRSLSAASYHNQCIDQNDLRFLGTSNQVAVGSEPPRQQQINCKTSLSL